MDALVACFKAVLQQPLCPATSAATTLSADTIKVLLDSLGTRVPLIAVLTAAFGALCSQPCLQKLSHAILPVLNSFLPSQAFNLAKLACIGASVTEHLSGSNNFKMLSNISAKQLAAIFDQCKAYMPKDDSIDASMHAFFAFCYPCFKGSFPPQPRTGSGHAAR